MSGATKRGFIRPAAPAPRVQDVSDWLLEPDDPAVRARALVDLQGRAEDDAEVLEARLAGTARGSAARVLAGLRLEGADRASLYRPKYGGPFHRLVALAEMGAAPTQPDVAALLDACLAAFFAPPGEHLDPAKQEVCLTGNLARAAILLGRGRDARVQQALRWLLDAQLPDGGWHCWPETTPHGTLDAWEALGAFAAVPAAARSAEMRAAIRRGVEHFLEKRLGVDDPYEPWRRIHAPRHYYYDVLVGLELATALSDPNDARLAPALGWLRSKRGADGRWRLDAQHPDLSEGAEYAFRPTERVAPLVVEAEGAPSKWATLAALRVLGRTGAPHPS